MAAVKGITVIAAAAGTAKPSPKLGQALGPLGVNMMEFCKQFNDKTDSLAPSAIMRVRLTAFEDRTFNFDILPPSTSWFLKRVTGLSKGAASAAAGAGTVSVKAVYEIAKAKQKYDPSLEGMSTEAVAKMVLGSASSMGLQVTR